MSRQCREAAQFQTEPGKWLCTLGKKSMHFASSLTVCYYLAKDCRTSACRPNLRPLLLPRSTPLLDGDSGERGSLDAGSSSSLAGRVSSLAAAEHRPEEPIQLGGQTIIKAADLAAGERTCASGARSPACSFVSTLASRSFVCGCGDTSNGT